MMPFNPFSALTSKIFGGLSLALLLAVGLLYAGYSHRGAKIEDLRTDLAETKAALKVSNASIDALEASIQAQNEAVEAMRVAAELMTGNAEKALRQAEMANRTLSADIDRIKRRKITDCDTGEEVLSSGL